MSATAEAFKNPPLLNPSVPGDDTQGERDESLRLIHVVAMLLCALAFGIDLMEMALGPAYAAIFSAPAHRLDSALLTVLLCAVYAGAVVGAPSLGWLADRHGLRTGIIVATLWLSVTSLLAATSASVTSLIVWRTLSGVALGGLPPLVIAYMTDLAPRAFRGMVIFCMCAVGYLMPPAAVFFLRAYTPGTFLDVEAWRWPLLAGSITAVVVGILLHSIPEAPHWLAGTGRTARYAAVHKRIGSSRVVWQARGAGRGAQATPVARRRGGRKLLLLSSISATTGAATVSFPLVTGPILLARHVNLSDTLLYIGLSTFGPIVATLIAGPFVGKRLRTTTMTICASTMLICAVVFVIAKSANSMAGALIVYTVVTSLYMPTLTTYGAEMFRPTVRAKATSTAWLANRVAAILAPALLIPLSHSGNVIAVGLVLCATLIANLLLVRISAGQPSFTRGHAPIHEFSDRLTTLNSHAPPPPP